MFGISPGIKWNSIQSRHNRHLTNFPRETFYLDGKRAVQRRLSNDDGNENGKKQWDWISKTTVLHVHHTFLYISWLLYLLHDHDVNTPEKFTYIERHGIGAINIETAWIHFLNKRLFRPRRRLRRLLSSQIRRGTLTCVLGIFGRTLPQNMSLALRPKCHGYDINSTFLKICRKWDLSKS